MTANEHALTGAYVVDALPEPQRRQFERHLARCPDCAQEVAELRAATTRLGLAATHSPPAGLRTRVRAEITTVRQEPPRAIRAVHGRARGIDRRWTTRLLASAAVAAVLAATGLGILTVHDQRQLDATRAQVAQAQDRYQPITRILAAPDARTVTGSAGPSSGSATVITSARLDAGVLTVSGLPTVAATSTYQAWLIGPSGPRSAGLLGPGGTAQLPLSTVDGSNRLAITVEPAGGSPQPTTIPVLAVRLPT